MVIMIFFKCIIRISTEVLHNISVGGSTVGCTYNDKVEVAIVVVVHPCSRCHLESNKVSRKSYFFESTITGVLQQTDRHRVRILTTDIEDV